MSEERQDRTERRLTDRRINSVSGGILLIWTGFALLVETGWGTGLLEAPRRSFAHTTTGC